MSKKLLVINAVGLTENLINDDCPNLKYYYEKKTQRSLADRKNRTDKKFSEEGITGIIWY